MRTSEPTQTSIWLSMTFELKWILWCSHSHTLGCSGQYFLYLYVGLIGLEVLTVVAMKSSILWYIMLFLGESDLMFQINIMPPSSGSNCKPSKKPCNRQYWRSSWYVPSEHWLTFAGLDNFISQKPELYMLDLFSCHSHKCLVS
jgi:hypothetical protein